MEKLESKIVTFFKKIYFHISEGFELYDCNQEKQCFAPKGYVKCPLHGGKPIRPMTYDEFYNKELR